ncbi:MAG: hypothetical protein KDE27_06290 [Planctomycetes bacterium]|nr:hypothetical protein [Planctomycetota bacterium]
MSGRLRLSAILAVAVLAAACHDPHVGEVGQPRPVGVANGLRSYDDFVATAGDATLRDAFELAVLAHAGASSAEQGGARGDSGSPLERAFPVVTSYGGRLTSLRHQVRSGGRALPVVLRQATDPDLIAMWNTLADDAASYPSDDECGVVAVRERVGSVFAWLTCKREHRPGAVIRVDGEDVAGAMWIPIPSAEPDRAQYLLQAPCRREQAVVTLHREGGEALWTRPELPVRSARPDAEQAAGGHWHVRPYSRNERVVVDRKWPTDSCRVLQSSDGFADYLRVGCSDHELVVELLPGRPQGYFWAVLGDAAHSITLAGIARP